MKRTPVIEQPVLSRAVCSSTYKGEVCTLLHPHGGKHLSGRGVQWGEEKKG